MQAKEQINPDFGKIIQLCLKELDIKYPDYGNSWMDGNKDYWIKRRGNEIEEYEKSMTPQSEKRKLLNIINMCAMAWEVTDDSERNLV